MIFVKPIKPNDLPSQENLKAISNLSLNVVNVPSYFNKYTFKGV